MVQGQPGNCGELRTTFSVPAEADYGKEPLDNDGGDVAADSNGHHLHLLILTSHTIGFFLSLFFQQIQSFLHFKTYAWWAHGEKLSSS